MAVPTTSLAPPASGEPAIVARRCKVNKQELIAFGWFCLAMGLVVLFTLMA